MVTPRTKVVVAASCRSGDIAHSRRPGTPGLTVGRFSQAFHGLSDLPRREVVDHVPGAFDDLQHAAPDLGREMLGAAPEHDFGSADGAASWPRSAISSVLVLL